MCRCAKIGDRMMMGKRQVSMTIVAMVKRAMLKRRVRVPPWRRALGLRKMIPITRPRMIFKHLRKILGGMQTRRRWMKILKSMKPK